MPCCLCEPRPYGDYDDYGLHTICSSCYEGAKSIILSTNLPKKNKSTNNDSFSPSISNKGFVKALKWMKLQEVNIKFQEVNMKLHDEKINYLSVFATALRDQIHPDIQVMAGDNEPPIPAHRGLLATRSVIFRNMLDSDECKAPVNQTITVGRKIPTNQELISCNQGLIL